MTGSSPRGSATPAGVTTTRPTGTIPGHAEAVEIVFDPERISYRDILEFFFQIHDPTTKDRQGNDVGSSYRSEIFYLSDEQRQVARGHDRRRRRLGPVARQGRHRGQRGRPVLGGRGRAPGLPPALPQRLHLPLPAAGLEAAPPRDRRLTRRRSPPAGDEPGRWVRMPDGLRVCIAGACVPDRARPVLARRRALGDRARRRDRRVDPQARRAARPADPPDVGMARRASRLRRRLRATHARPSTVSSYSARYGGALTTVTVSLPVGQGAACWVAVSPDGRYAYTGNASGSISEFAIAPSGALTALNADGRPAVLRCQTGDGWRVDPG